MPSSFPAPEPRSRDVSLTVVDESPFWLLVLALLVGLSVTPVGVCGIWAGLKGMSRDWLEFFLIPVGIGFCSIGVLAIGFAGKNLLPKFDAPSLTLSVSPLLLGESFHVVISQRIKREADVNSVTVSLICQEWIETGSGDSRRVETHGVCRVTQVLDVAGRISPPDAIRGKLEFQIPEDAMHSFQTLGNRIDWLIEVRSDVAKWPDYKWQFKLNVAARSVKSGSD